jgi:hypothetical protein
MISFTRHSTTRSEPPSRKARRMLRASARIRRSGRVALLLAVATVVAFPSATADAGVALNMASAQTLLGKRTDVKVAFQVRTDSGPIESATNAAVAHSSSCQGCNTVAISVQIDLVSGTVSRIDGRNSAEARTWNCIACNTLATAEQFVVAPGTTGVRLTDQGARDLQSVDGELEQVARSGLSALDLQSRIDALMNRVLVVLQTEVTAGQAATAGVAGATPFAAASAAAPVPVVPVQRRGGTVVAQGPTEARFIG